MYRRTTNSETSIGHRRPTSIRVQRLLRFSAASVLGVAITQVLLQLFYRFTEVGAAWSNVLAVGLATIPDFLVLRRWVWGRTGERSVTREVLPFWAYTFVGLGLSTVVVAVVEDRWPSAAAVSVANLATYGALWVTKFFLLDQWLFVDRGTSVAASGPDRR